MLLLLFNSAASTSTIAGVTRTVTASLLPGATRERMPGVTLVATTSLLSGGVPRRVPGTLLTANTSLLPGAARERLPGALLIVSATLLPGAVRERLPGVSLAAAVALLPGGIPRRVSGVLQTVPASLIPGAAVTRKPGVTISVSLSLAPGAASALVVLLVGTARLSLSPEVLTSEKREVTMTVFGDWGETKKGLRRSIHDAFAVEAIYTPPGPNPRPFACRVRWHNNGESLLGDNRGQGYGETLTAKERVVFSKEQLAMIGVDRVERGGKLLISGYDEMLVLDSQSPGDGPINDVWEVVRG